MSPDLAIITRGYDLRVNPPKEAIPHYIIPYFSTGEDLILVREPRIIVIGDLGDEALAGKNCYQFLHSFLLLIGRLRI